MYIFNDVGISTQLWHKGGAVKHNHEFYEIVYVIQGEIKHTLNGVSDNLTVGDLRLLTPTDVHEIFRPADCSQRDIFIKKDLFEQFCQTVFGTSDFISQNPSSFKATLSDDKLNKLETLVQQFTIETAVEKKRCVGFEAILKVLNILLSFNPQADNSFNTYPLAIKQIITNLNHPLALKKSVSDIIEKTGYNTSYISRLFKKHTGEKLSDYLKNLRLKHVAYYLKTTDLSLREIADIVGVESLSYLNSIFKKKYGEPPIQYRKTNRTNNK